MPSAAFPELELLAVVAAECTVSGIYERLRRRFACARCTVWRALQRAEAKELVERTSFDCDVWELTRSGQRKLAKAQQNRPTCPCCGEQAGSRLEPAASECDYRPVPMGRLCCRWCRHVWAGTPAEAAVAERRDRVMQTGCDLFALATEDT